MKTVLLVIDIQQALIDEHPVRMDEFLMNVHMLMNAAHQGGTEVGYVRHDGGEGDVLAYGLPGWEIERSIIPREGERIFDKRFRSAFLKTGLHEYLQEQQITRLILCGMQTEYCVATSAIVAFELGYEVIIPSGATTTYSNPFLSCEKLINYYERMIWTDPLVNVISMEQALEQLKI